ncbi:MAG: hypothetical protein A2231_05185 [Candidatus Firestonebacteria bacterium RIFOXYA2_FULL_40_8]|nr:MAG: hypothetical protein A2231_05185 [Candidatus Firestonebacteria bacterium RIFOXYA2_FULL_40_8]
MNHRDLKVRIFLFFLFIFISGSDLKAGMDIKQLEQWLKAPGYVTRETALKAIGKQKEKELLPKVLEIIQKDKDERVRKQCAIALGEIGSKDATEVLLKMLAEDSSVAVKAESAKALGLIKDTSAIEKLLQYLHEEFSKSRSVRVAIVRSLGEIGDPSVSFFLVELLSDADNEARKEAIRALDMLNEPKAQYFIIDMIDGDPDISVRLLACDYLSRKGTKKMITELENVQKNIVKEKYFEVRDKIPLIIKAIKKRERIK